MLRLGIIASSISKAIIDLFNRVTSGSLGTATSGQIWGATRGVWFANGTQAQSNDAASTYPIASIPLSQNSTMKIDTSGGCGLSFWVTDAGSWWGAYPFYTSSTVLNCTGPDAYCYSAGCTPVNSCGTINQTTNTTCSGPDAYCYSAGCTPANSCGSINQTTNTTCSGPDSYCYSAGCTPSNSCGTINQTTSSTCTGPTASCSGAGCIPPNSCGAISESSNTTCTGPTVSCSDTTNTCNPGGCGAVSFTSAVYGGGTFADDTPCSLTGGTNSPCYNCGLTGTNPPNCGPNPFFYCCSYPSYTEYTRTQNTNVTTITRSSATNVTSYTRWSPTNVTTYTRWSPTNVTTYTRWSATNVGLTTYTTSIRVISSVSGTVATESTTTLATSTSSRPIVASMEANTTGDVITIKGYSAVGQTTQLGSTITRTPVSPVKGTGVGIIKAPTTDDQGSTLDNYSASN